MVSRFPRELRISVALVVLGCALLPGCGPEPGPRDAPREPEAASEPERGDSDDVSEGSVATTSEVEDDAVVFVRDGLVVNRAFGFSLAVPAGVTLAGSSPDGASFVLEKDGTPFVTASVEGVRTSWLEDGLRSDGDASRAVALRRSTDLCSADGPEGSAYCTGPLVHEREELASGRRMDVFTLRRVREEFGETDTSRMKLEETGPHYWIPMDPDENGVRGLLVRGWEETGDGAWTVPVRPLVETFRATEDDPRAPAAIMTLDGAIEVREDPVDDLARVGAIGPMTVVPTTGTARVLTMEGGPPRETWYEVEVDEGRSWVNADEVADLATTSWDGSRRVFRAGSTVDDEMAYWWVMDRDGGLIQTLQTRASEVDFSPSARRYASLEQVGEAPAGRLVVRDVDHDLVVYQVEEVHSFRFEGETIVYEVASEMAEVGAAETFETSYYPPAVPGGEDGGEESVMTARYVQALDRPHIMEGAPVMEVPEGTVEAVTNQARPGLLSYGDAGFRTGLWVQIWDAGTTGWVPGEDLAYEVGRPGEVRIFRGAADPTLWFVLQDLVAPNRTSVHRYELENGERLDCHGHDVWCLVDHGGDPVGTFTLLNGPTGEVLLEDEFIGRAPHWVGDGVVGYQRVAGETGPDGWIPVEAVRFTAGG